MFDMAPGYYARYRNAAGDVREMRHYDDDAEQWTDGNGTVWTRTAVTAERHLNRSRWLAELDRLEAQAKS